MSVVRRSLLATVTLACFVLGAVIAGTAAFIRYDDALAELSWDETDAL